MRIWVHNHQSKASRIITALRKLGHDVTPKDPELLIMDHAGPEYYRKIIDHYNAPVLLYDHGSYSYLGFDGRWEMHPGVIGYLAQGCAQRDIMRFFLDIPVEVVGWYFCEQKEFETRSPRNVLFAPVHVLSNGYIRPEFQEANRRVFEDLLSLPVTLAVRHIGALEAAGLWRESGVRYIDGQPNNSHHDIDATDVVVSHGTFAYMSVARGKPTVMYAQDVRYADGHSDLELIEAKNWPYYEGWLEYPYSEWPLARNIERACEREASGWRKDFIGEQMTPERLDRSIYKLLEGVKA